MHVVCGSISSESGNDKENFIADLEHFQVAGGKICSRGDGKLNIHKYFPAPAAGSYQSSPQVLSCTDNDINSFMSL